MGRNHAHVWEERSIHGSERAQESPHRIPASVKTEIDVLPFVYKNRAIFMPEKLRDRESRGWNQNERLSPELSPNGGEEEIRTLDPHVANVMLYQLSYFPIRGNGT